MFNKNDSLLLKDVLTVTLHKLIWHFLYLHLPKGTHVVEFHVALQHNNMSSFEGIHQENLGTEGGSIFYHSH